MSEPTFLSELDAARRAGEQVLATGNLLDLYLMPFDGEHRPLPLTEAIALHFERQAEPLATLRFSLAGGLEVVGVPGELRRSSPPSGLPTGFDPVEVFPALTRVMRRTPCVVCLSFADFYLRDDATGREDAFTVQTVAEWGADPEIRQRGSLVVVIAPQGRVHPLIARLGSGFRSVTVTLPDREERTRMLSQLDLVSRRASQFAGLAGDLDLTSVARDAGGLRLVDLYRLSRERRAEGAALDQESITERKAATIRELAGGVLEVHEGEVDLRHVAGLDHVTGYVRRAQRSGATPRGMLLVGPPGTGKSLVVRLIAHHLGLPLVSLRNIHEQWVGASERNLELALWILESLAPVVVWVDEIDQFIGGQRNTGTSADGGTSERLLARLLEFMGDHSAQRGIAWVGTSNRPDVIDSAIEDRFPVTIPLIHPSVEEIAELLPALAAQQGRSLDPSFDADVHAVRLAELAPSVRTLVQLIERAGLAAERRGGNETSLRDTDLSEAIDDVRDRTDVVEREFLALTAITKATYRSLFPWTARPKWTPPAYLRSLLHTEDATGGWRLDEEALARRLDELAQQRSQRRWQR